MLQQAAGFVEGLPKEHRNQLQVRGQTIELRWRKGRQQVMGIVGWQGLVDIVGDHDDGRLRRLADLHQLVLQFCASQRVERPEDRGVPVAEVIAEVEKAIAVLKQEAPAHD